MDADVGVEEDDGNIVPSRELTILRVDTCTCIAYCLLLVCNM